MHSTTQCHALVLGTTGTTYIRQQHKYVGRENTYTPVRMDLAHRRLTPDFNFYVSGGGMNCVDCDICVVVCVFPRVLFLSSRVTGACPVTADFITLADVRTTTTTIVIVSTISPPVTSSGHHFTPSDVIRGHSERVATTY